MRILLCTTEAIPRGGGIASYNQEIISVLSQSNEMFLLTNENISTLNGFKKVYSNYGHNQYSFKYCLSIINIIENEHIHLIINSASIVCALIAPFVRVPIISVSHYVNRELAYIAGYNGTFLSKIITLSNSGKLYLKNKFSLQDDKISVVYNFVGYTENFNEINKIKAKKLRLVYPGGSSVHKSFDTVLQSLLLLCKEEYDFEFYWLGKTNIPINFLSIPKKIENFFKDKRIIFTGKVSREEAINIISSSNVFILPSKGEGCPMTLLEAFNSGCIPIVSDAHHASRELLEKGNVGIIIRQDDYCELYNCLKDIITHHSCYVDNYRSVANFAKNNLSQQKWLSQMESIIRECLVKEKVFLKISKYTFYIKSVHLYMKMILYKILTKLEYLKVCMFVNFIYLKKNK